jgi:hypothetical protein
MAQSGRGQAGTSMGAVGKGASGRYSQLPEATMSAPPLNSPDRPYHRKQKNRGRAR